MLWLFTREQQSLTVETRYDNDRDEYIATTIRATGFPEATRFKTAEAFLAWLLALERNLMTNGWTPEGASHTLPDHWPDRISSE